MIPSTSILQLRALGLSFLAAWLTAWAAMAACTVIGNLDNSAASITDSAGLALIYGVATLVVVGATWILLATPYYLFCIRRHPTRKSTHFLCSGLLAILIAALMSDGRLETWLGLGAIACLSALAGTFILLRHNPLPHPTTPDPHG
ncbi:MAG TPA: hypothetical protein VFY13_05750 [Luteolibacter sp.]|nr:hypothetical protein [Luteolibacter sp.]